MDTDLRSSIRLSDVPTDLNSLIDEWCGRYSDRRTHVQIRGGAITEERSCECGIVIFTDNNSYRINARWGGQTKSYLGCVASSRKPRAGEDWPCGSDLTDGPFTYETWFRILADIVSYELVPIAKSRRPVPDGHAFPSHDPITVNSPGHQQQSAGASATEA